MIDRYFRQFLSILTIIVSLAGLSLAQSSRPRRVKQPPPPPEKPAEEPLLRPEPNRVPPLAITVIARCLMCSP
jgi:hypothetical protein